MLEMLCEENAWRSGLKKFYGASSCSKWQQLAGDVQCVSVGLKPAYLLDTILPDPALLCSLLDHILLVQSSDQHQKAVDVTEWKNELRVVGIGSDVMIVNLTTIHDLFRSSSPVYLDISKHEGQNDSNDHSDAHIGIHCSSEVEDKCREWYSELCAADRSCEMQTGCASSSAGVRLLSVALPPDLNVCTLFGRLLGYPAVYWFNTNTDYCLDLVELVNYQVTVSSASNSDGSQDMYTLKV